LGQPNQNDQGRIMQASRSPTRFLFALLIAIAGLDVARADALDDDLQSVWESLWSQSGMPLFVSRWPVGQAITFRITGDDAPRHRAHLVAAVQAVTGAAGLVAEDVSDRPDSDRAAVLQLEVARDSDLQPTMPCYTQLTPQPSSNVTIATALVRMRSSEAWRCAFHEMMHAMGIAGHPSGRTVLSYFPYRRDVLMPLDRTMLAAWYSPAMKTGATPIEALAVLGEALVQREEAGARAAASARVDVFKRSALAQLQAVAAGTGKPPTIVLRSGRANSTSMEASRGLAAFFVGAAYASQALGTPDLKTALPWFERSATRGFSGGQVTWAYLLTQGVGMPKDLLAAHGWLMRAHAAGHPGAMAQMLAIEKNWTLEEIENARARPAPLLETN
jgi:hypothetical protein